ncbi:MAG: aminotransferase class I/II-fold pyridoxal phosphate-dependent enzyme [bacterium]
MKPNSTTIPVNLNLNVRGLKTSATLAINERCQQLQQAGKEVFRLGLGQSPFPVPEVAVEALRRNAHQKDYLPVTGLRQLREAVAAFNFRNQNVDTHPDHIMIGPGSKELIFLLQLVYCGDLVIPTPSWVSYSPQARIIGRNVFWAPAREDNFWRLSYQDLEDICKRNPDRPRILILNYPSNPTGYTYPVERLKLLADVARKYRVILVSDEIYGMIHHQGLHISISQFYPEGTIISSGLSKWCGAGGWRLGTFSFPPDLKWLMDAMAVVASETYTSTSAPIQYAAVAAFSQSDEIDNYLIHVHRILTALAYYLTMKLHEMKVNISLPHGAFYLFPNFEVYRESLKQRDIFDSTTLCKRILEDTGVAMLPGKDFAPAGNELTARIAYVDFDGRQVLKASMEAGIERDLTEAFIREHCPRMVEAFDRLGSWFSRLQ